MLSTTFTYMYIRGQSCTWAKSTCIIHSGHYRWPWLLWPTKMYYCWRLPLESEYTEVDFLPDSSDLLYLQLAQMLRSLDLVIFVSMMTMTMMTTKPITFSIAHAHGVIMCINATYSTVNFPHFHYTLSRKKKKLGQTKLGRIKSGQTLVFSALVAC